jgi:2-methylcitrate dehydratase PrpD
MGDEPDLPRLLDGLGETWEIAKNTYKPYPAGIVFHSVIDACLLLRDRIGQQVDQVDQVESVAVQGSALLLARGDRVVNNARDARVSIHHCVACALLLGAAGVAEFAHETVVRSDIAQLRQKVTAELDGDMPDGAARVTVRLSSGEVVSETVIAPRGSLAAPLGDRDIGAKLRDSVRVGGSDWDADRVIEAVWRLDAVNDVADLLESLRPPRQSCHAAFNSL